jgi:hypothetical protein
MTYEAACKILGFTTPKTKDANAELATSRLHRMTIGIINGERPPLRFQVACQILIDAAK